MLYGLLASACFAVSFLYLIGFTGNLLVPKSIDSGLPEPIGRALPIDLLLVSIFAVQHSVMARQGFKKWWTRMVPAPVERSTYVLLASIATGLLFWQWRPIPVVVWNVENPAGRALLILMFCLGWVLLLLATMLIAPLDLLGLRQIYAYGRGTPYNPPGFSTPALYRCVRHPVYLGFLTAFWAAPRMTVGHVVFAAAMTVYILAGISLEERDLVRTFGDAYRQYRRQVPMLLPLRRRR